MEYELMKNKLYEIYSVLAEKNLKHLLSKLGIDFSQSKTNDVWQAVKEFSKVAIEISNKREFDIYCTDSYIFEASLSEKENIYYFLLTRIFKIYVNFIKYTEVCFHFVFAYHPIPQYMNFKGQLYSEDFASKNEFFTVIEDKDVFRTYINQYKPINVTYLVKDRLITNFK